MQNVSQIQKEIEQKLDMSSESSHTIQKGSTRRITKEYSELCKIKDLCSGKDIMKNEKDTSTWYASKESDETLQLKNNNNK